MKLYNESRRGLSLVVGPVAEPVTVSLAKQHLVLGIDDDDDFIRTVLIPAARSFVEKYTRRALYKQTWSLTLDRVPEDGIVDLVVPPVMAVTGVTYVDSEGAPQTIAPTAYSVDLSGEDARVYCAAWPVTKTNSIGTIKITYTSGYTDGIIEGQNGGLPIAGDPLNKIPSELKLAILILVGHFYENRELINVSMSGAPLPFGLEDILGPSRSIRF